jgi:2-C-methyl-D-erythritol 4-phosphate cytidylyltransferase/2-C-methyl-D-erythritol 2,4-cyclodiphosphate synthase
VLAWTARAFLGHPAIDRVQAVIHPDDRDLYEAVARAAASPKLLPPVFGAATRQGSVRAGLEALAPAPPEAVLVHDGARPFPAAGLIERAIAAVRSHPAAVPGLPVTDTVKVVDSGGLVRATPERAALRAVQTPQAFAFGALLDAHRRAHAAGVDGLTDDGALAEWAGLPVLVFAGDPGNLKLTTGFDVHAFAAGDHVWLGGVRIPHAQGVEAHSDGDVILHALTDALLGALADGDIGVHFPPSDPRWRGASSDRFLAHAVARVRERGGVVDHLDATLLCEAPRLGPHREAMRARIAAIAGIRIDQVSLKATTTERLGFTGRREGLAAQAAATIRLPEPPR